MKKLAKLSIVFCLLSILSYCSACSYINKKLGLENDNILEQSVEAVIQAETGLSVDLTPGD